MLLFCALVHLYAVGQTQEQIQAVMNVMGMMQAEDVTEDDLERLADIFRHPVRINYADRNELESCGLFTAFQIVSLEDYISRHGAVLSLTELSSVDGFSSRSIQALAPFISLDCEHMYASYNKRKRRICVDADSRTVLKHTTSKSTQWSHSTRIKVGYDDGIMLSISASRSYDSQQTYPDRYSANITWRHNRGKLIAGDFNARFGQGICLWNTATIVSSFSPSSFMKRASGISPSYSFTGSYALSGLAGELAAGKYRFSFLFSLPDIKNKNFNVSCLNLAPALNITRYFRFGHIGVTHYTELSDALSYNFRIPQMRSSADASFCFRGVNVFCESMYDWVCRHVSVIAGVETCIGEYVNIAAKGRCVSADEEHGITLGGEFVRNRHNVVLSADLMCKIPELYDSAGLPYQIKFQGKWRWVITEILYSEMRVTERIRSWSKPFRTDARVDVHSDVGKWSFSSRVNLLCCAEVGVLGYVDVGYNRHGNMKIYFRQGVFRIDNWDDRIYVYERDAPGNFNVPALYGRGLWSSIYASWKFARWGSVWLRSSYTSYPLMREKKKPGKAELKLQLSLHF